MTIMHAWHLGLLIGMAVGGEAMLMVLYVLVLVIADRRRWRQHEAEAERHREAETEQHHKAEAERHLMSLLASVSSLRILHSGTEHRIDDCSIELRPNGLSGYTLVATVRPRYGLGSHA